MQQARGVNDAANSSSGHAPRIPAVDVSLAFEVSGFVVELVAKRPRIEPERLDSRPEDAGTAAMVNRDYDAEWVEPGVGPTRETAFCHILLFNASICATEGEQ